MNLPTTMQAMVFERPGRPLVMKQLSVPTPATDQVLIRVVACGVCRTDLHIVDGELDRPKLPLVPGHEIVGRVMRVGADVHDVKEGEFIGVPWLAYTCGKCKFCISGRENLCDNALFTGYTVDGGFAEYVVAYQKYCFPLAPIFANPGSAPLLCAGLIGYRSYSFIGKEAKNIGIYGFGAAAHILIQLAKHQGKNIYAFTRDGDNESQSFARKLGATWSGGSSEVSPVPLDGSIVFAPVGSLVPKALRDLDKGGVVVCGGIHMSDIPSFPYNILWEERMIHSVANLTRKDGQEFLRLAAELPVRTEIQVFALSAANEALGRLRNGQIQGAAVLVMV